jgi:hypothetical protein
MNNKPNNKLNDGMKSSVNEKNQSGSKQAHTEQKPSMGDQSRSQVGKQTQSGINKSHGEKQSGLGKNDLEKDDRKKTGERSDKCNDKSCD